MRFRIGLMVGFAAGYVAGTAAGRERYEQIKEGAQRLWESPQLEPIRSQAQRRIIRLQNGTGWEEPDPNLSPAQEPFASAGDQGGPLPR